MKFGRRQSEIMANSARVYEAVPKARDTDNQIGSTVEVVASTPGVNLSVGTVGRYLNALEVAGAVSHFSVGHKRHWHKVVEGFQGHDKIVLGSRADMPTQRSLDLQSPVIDPKNLCYPPAPRAVDPHLPPALPPADPVPDTPSPAPVEKVEGESNPDDLTSTLREMVNNYDLYKAALKAMKDILNDLPLE